MPGRADLPVGLLCICAANWSKRVPLALTLSLGEREQPLADPVKSESNGAAFSRGFAQTLGTFLPLPKGEGWGEGKCRSGISEPMSDVAEGHFYFGTDVFQQEIGVSILDMTFSIGKWSFLFWN